MQFRTRLRPCIISKLNLIWNARFLSLLWSLHLHNCPMGHSYTGRSVGCSSFYYLFSYNVGCLHRTDWINSLFLNFFIYCNSKCYGFCRIRPLKMLKNS
jgi:hypothetical protein